MENNILNYRAKVIEKFINIETLINAIICQHYFHKLIMPFYLEVLYDENFNFSLRRNIFEKILRKLDKYDNKKIQDLHKLNKIRNYFGHCNQEIFRLNKNGSVKDSGVPDPKKIENYVDFNEIYKEFIELEPKMTVYLAKVFKEMGGKTSKSLWFYSKEILRIWLKFIKCDRGRLY